MYDFLNPNPRTTIIVDGEPTHGGGFGKAGVAGTVIGIAAGICVLFAIVKGVAWVRKWATEKKLDQRGKFYAGRDMGMGEVELETQRVWEK